MSIKLMRLAAELRTRPLDQQLAIAAALVKEGPDAYRLARSIIDHVSGMLAIEELRKSKPSLPRRGSR